jgi:hypothetical protein
MKFLLRSLLVLAIAILSGVMLYYAVQQLPGAGANRPPGTVFRPEENRTRPENISPRSSRPQGDRRNGLRWQSLLQIGRRVLVFSTLMLVSVLGKNLIFDRRPKRKNSPD